MGWTDEESACIDRAGDLDGGKTDEASSREEAARPHSRMENREWQLGPATGVGWVRSRVLKWAW